MDFLSRITERHTHFLLALDKIHQNTLPVVLCGSGYVAEFVDRVDTWPRTTMPIIISFMT